MIAISVVSVAMARKSTPLSHLRLFFLNEMINMYADSQFVHTIAHETSHNYQNFDLDSTDSMIF